MQQCFPFASLPFPGHPVVAVSGDTLSALAGSRETVSREAQRPERLRKAERQKGLPSSAPMVRGNQVAGACFPARQVDGDLFDTVVAAAASAVPFVLESSSAQQVVDQIGRFSAEQVSLDDLTVLVVRREEACDGR